MAHFYGSVRGQARTMATRRGSKVGGMSAHIRGWDIGARVELIHLGGKDVVRVYKTSGSNAKGSDELVSEFGA